LIERWLQGDLRLSSTEAHEAAHGLEAGFNDELLDRLFESIGRPTHCPHGNPIPGSGAELDHSGTYLDDVKPGERVWLARITEEAEADLDLLEYLERNEVKPGTPLDIIAVDRKTGAVTARTGSGREIRLELRSAALIYVRREESAAAA
jgi:DtxR family Mn-dependent transcriptional regulator